MSQSILRIQRQATKTRACKETLGGTRGDTMICLSGILQPRVAGQQRARSGGKEGSDSEAGGCTSGGQAGSGENLVFFSSVFIFEEAPERPLNGVFGHLCLPCIFFFLFFHTLHAHTPHTSHTLSHSSFSSAPSVPSPPPIPHLSFARPHHRHSSAEVCAHNR